jgi:hypothetical protein
MLLAAFMLFGLAACSDEPAGPTPCKDCDEYPCECEDEKCEECGEDPCECEEVEPRPTPGVYDESLVIYKTIFDNPEEVCGADCGCENQNTPVCGRMWTGRGGDEKLMLTDEYAFEGSSSLLIYNRQRGWSGAIMDLVPLLEGDIVDIEVLAWVRLTDDSVGGRVIQSRKTTPAGGGEATYGWLGDANGEGGILSKYFLPIEEYGNDPVTNEEPNPGQDAQYNIPDFMQFTGADGNDGWVLLRGQTSYLRGLYDEFHFYIEGSNSAGPSFDMNILVGKVVILAETTM